MTEKPILKIRKPPKAYPINFEKLKGESMGTLPYLLGVVRFSEDYEHFDKVKKFLKIPEKPKSIEELQQELEEKFEKLIEKTHLEYRIGHNWLYKLRKYEEFCKKQDADYEYARKNGFFPLKYTLDYSKLSVFGDGSNSVSFGTEFRVGKTEMGYWDIKPNIRVYLEKKPNLIVRYFTKLLLDFTWKDK